MSAALGPECKRCNTNEAQCARDGGCCGECTHTFDGNDLDIGECADCGREYLIENKRGRPPVRCEECLEKRRPKANIDLSMYTWYVAETGRAHLYSSAIGGLAACGARQWHGQAAADSWPQKCKRCLGIAGLELEESA